MSQNFKTGRHFSRLYINPLVVTIAQCVDGLCQFNLPGLLVQIQIHPQMFYFIASFFAIPGTIAPWSADQ